MACHLPGMVASFRLVRYYVRKAEGTLRKIFSNVCLQHIQGVNVTVGNRPEVNQSISENALCGSFLYNPRRDPYGLQNLGKYGFNFTCPRPLKGKYLTVQQNATNQEGGGKKQEMKLVYLEILYAEG